MRLAIAEAERALTHDDVPVGAVILDPGGELLGAGHNERELLQDPSAHAEMLAIRAAAAAVGSWRLLDTTLYVTLEPCAMCAGAIVLARIPRVVYGTADPKAGAPRSGPGIPPPPPPHHPPQRTPGGPPQGRAPPAGCSIPPPSPASTTVPRSPAACCSPNAPPSCSTSSPLGDAESLPCRSHARRGARVVESGGLENR